MGDQAAIPVSADKDFNSFAEFESGIDEFFRRSPRERQRFIFRGHADSNWPLLSTLDRFLIERTPKADRKSAQDQLLRSFKVQGAMVDPGTTALDERQFLLLARHQGLPTPVFDWTRSPYIALYFACAGAERFAGGQLPDRIAVWCLDCESLHPDRGLLEKLELIDGVEAIMLNNRAIDQQSVFLEVRSGDPPLQELLKGHLVRFTLPTTETSSILDRLDYMRINAAQLFRSLQAAAETASRETQ